MKKTILVAFLIAQFCARAQNDTILYLGLTDILLVDTGTFEPNPTLTTQFELGNWQAYTDGRTISAELTKDQEESVWYEEDLWKGWHKIPYIDSLDTTYVAPDSITVDTITNFGLRSFSWFQTPNQCNNLLLSPDVWISDNTAKLKWRSMPLQGPRHQDGYKVFILTGGGMNVEDVPVGALNPDFVMQQMDASNGSPSQAITSLSYLKENYPFIPSDGEEHIRYTLPDSNELGEIDSTRQHPFMQEFELDLSAYSGFIQVAFYHDSYDNNGMILDDVLITGTGSVGVQEIESYFKFYPNPVQNQLHIENLNQSDILSIHVFTLQGSLVKSLNGSQRSVNFSNLNNGVYIIQVNTSKGNVQTRVLKVN